MPATGLREYLFGDVPLADWGAAGTGEPWQRFRTAADALARGERGEAERVLKDVLATAGLEARQYAEAWTALRALGAVPPPAEETRLLAVVLDVPLPSGRDTLAVYEDGSARYLNAGGGTIVWDARGTDANVDARVRAVMEAGRHLVPAVGVWVGPRPPLAPGRARVSLLTPGGLRFGEGSLPALSRDRMAAPIFTAGAALVQMLARRLGPGPGSTPP